MKNRKFKIRPNREMELQQRIWAYEWIEGGLWRTQFALSWLFWPRDLRMSWTYAKNAAWCFYQAARRFWWARKFGPNEMTAGSARAVVYAFFQFIDELSHALHLDSTPWGFRFCQWCHRKD